MRDSRWLFGVFSGCALTGSLILLALAVREDERVLKATAKKAVGLVIELRSEETQADGRRTTTDWEVYEFETYMGQSVRFSSAVTERAPKRRVGDQVDVLYQLAAPEQARLDDDSLDAGTLYLLWSSPVGLLLAAISLFVWLRSRQTVGTAVAWAEEPSRRML